IFARIVTALRDAFINEETAFASLFDLEDASLPIHAEANKLLFNTLELIISPTSPAADWMESSADSHPFDGKTCIVGGRPHAPRHCCEGDCREVFVVVRKVEGKEGDMLPAGGNGGARQHCKCLFCGVVFAAQTARILSHLCGISGEGVAICIGVVRQSDETEVDYRQRNEYYQHAKARCNTVRESQKGEKDKKRERDGLNQATVLQACLGQLRRVSRRLSRRVSWEASAQKLADEALAHAFYTANVAPNVLDKLDFFVGLAYAAPERHVVEGPMLKADADIIKAQILTNKECAC
ncbi:hypothetical protein CYMTET_24971, partial [Cymbomonas tetramitiformis]